MEKVEVNTCSMGLIKFSKEVQRTTGTNINLRGKKICRNAPQVATPDFGFNPPVDSVI